MPRSRGASMLLAPMRNVDAILPPQETSVTLLLECGHTVNRDAVRERTRCEKCQAERDAVRKNTT